MRAFRRINSVLAAAGPSSSPAFRHASTVTSGAKSAKRRIRDNVLSGTGSEALWDINDIDRLPLQYQTQRTKGPGPSFQDVKLWPTKPAVPWKGKGKERADERESDSTAGRPSWPVPSHAKTPSRQSLSPRPRSVTRGSSGFGSPRTGASVRGDPAYQLSERLGKHIGRCKSPMRNEDVQKAISMVYEAPKSHATGPVWGRLFALLGREGRLDRMWTAFNDMKKRGVKPHTQMYTTLLNAYAQVPHAGPSVFSPKARPSERTLTRVELIYDQAQRHLRELMAKQNEMKEDDGLGGLLSQEGLTSDRSRDEDYMEQINSAATNSYLQFLSRHGMWDEMQSAFLQMDQDGPLAPDALTYTVMMSAVTKTLDTAPDHQDARQLIVERVRPLVNNILRVALQKAKVGERLIDDRLLFRIIYNLAHGTIDDKALAVKLINDTIDFTDHPGIARALARFDALDATKVPDITGLPRLPFTVDLALAVLVVLRLAAPGVAMRTVRLIMDSPLAFEADDKLCLKAIQIASVSGDIDVIMNIFNNYQPEHPWRASAYVDGLASARWREGSPDFESALLLLRRMTHLPKGVEHGKMIGPYAWETPNGEDVDVRGRVWRPTRPIPGDAKAMGFLFKSANGRGIAQASQALNIFQHFGRSTFFGSASRESGSQQRVERNVAQDSASSSRHPESHHATVLAAEVRRAAERVAEKAEGAEKAKLEVLAKDMRKLSPARTKSKTAAQTDDD